MRGLRGAVWSDVGVKGVQCLGEGDLVRCGEEGWGTGAEEG